MTRRQTYRATLNNPAPGVIRPADAKSFSWGNIGGQGFSLGNASFVMQDNGQGNFTCQLANVQNPITQDFFFAAGLGLHDANGLELYRIPEFSLGSVSSTPAPATVGLLYPAYMYAYITNLVLYQ